MITSLEVGVEVAGVRIEELAGRGGSSVVYRGTETATGRSVAVKVLQDPGAPARRRMQREADLLAQSEHRGIVRFHALHEHGDDLLLVTDWVDGEPLRRRPDGEGGYGEALLLLQALAEPLDHLHDAKVVHRDVSPSNIMCGDDGSVTLIDLGIGHQVGSATLTNHDLIAGTPQYLAPEIIRGESASARSDQYSLGVVVYELAAGRSPFPGADEIATALHHQLHTVPAPLNEIDPSIPAPLADAVERALSKDPHDRFASVGEFAAAASALVAPPLQRRGLPRAAIAAALLVAIAIIAVVVLTRSRDDGGALASPSAAETVDVEPVAPVPNPAAGLWQAGDAAVLTCNLLDGDDFENGSVPLDFFGNPPGRERVVESGGYDDTWALEVGIANNYGQYAEIVPVAGGVTYRFQGWFSTIGEVAVARIGITLFDEAFTQLDPETEVKLQASPGFNQVELDLPPQAAFALPWIFKDSSPGVLLADELVFGPAGECAAEIAGS